MRSWTTMLIVFLLSLQAKRLHEVFNQPFIMKEKKLDQTGDKKLKS